MWHFYVNCEGLLLLKYSLGIVGIQNPRNAISSRSNIFKYSRHLYYYFPLRLREVNQKHVKIVVTCLFSVTSCTSRVIVPVVACFVFVTFMPLCLSIILLQFPCNFVYKRDWGSEFACRLCPKPLILISTPSSTKVQFQCCVGSAYL